MVIGERFVWAHIPKTGGDSTKSMFDVISKSILYADKAIDNTKHDSFIKKQEYVNIDLSQKKRIANIRRLPHYILSFSQHYHKHNNQPLLIKNIKQGKIYWLEPWSSTGFKLKNIDESIMKYYNVENIDLWIRIEHLAEDFIKILSDFEDINENQKIEIKAIRKNTNNDYNKNITNWFNKKDLEILYQLCPVWAEIEKKQYGSLLINKD